MWQTTSTKPDMVNGMMGCVELLAARPFIESRTTEADLEPLGYTRIDAGQTTFCILCECEEEKKKNHLQQSKK